MASSSLIRSRAVVGVCALLLVLPLALAGCGDDDGGTAEDADAVEPLGAAEPGRSPEPTAEPAGAVTDLAMDPEGMVYASEVDVLAVATREPTALVLIEGSTGEEIRRVALPGHARHLQLAGPSGPVLVPAEDSDTFVSVTLPDGAVTETPVGEYPHDAARARSGRVLVADERGGTLSVLEDGEVVHTFEDRQQPGGLAAVGDGVAVVDVGDFTLSLYDVDAEERIATVGAGAGPTHIVGVSGDRVVVADTRGSEVLVFGTDPLAATGRLALPGTPYGIAYDDVRDVVWVSLTERNEVVGLDVSGTDPVEVMRFPTLQQPNTIAVDPDSGRLWVAGRATGQLQTIDP